MSGQGQAPVVPQHRADHRHDAEEHDDALDEVVPGRGHVPAQDHVHAREGRHEDDAHRVIDAGEGDGEEPGEAVVEGGRVGDQKDEGDEAGGRAQLPAFVSGAEEVRHGLAGEVLGHDPGPAAQYPPSEEGPDEGVPEADPRGRQAEAPPELARVAHEDDGGEVAGAVGEGGEPGAHLPGAQNEAVHVRGVAAGAEADPQHEGEEHGHEEQGDEGSHRFQSFPL